MPRVATKKKAEKKTLRKMEWMPPKKSKKPCPPKRFISKMEWIELIPHMKKRLNEDGCTYAFLGKELGERFGGKGETLSRARIEQQVRWLNENHDAGIQLRKCRKPNVAVLD
jgi:hypothetical protein